MNVIITPNKLSGTLNAVASKSDAHRKIIASALADSKTILHINNLSDDILATVGVINALGGKCEIKKDRILINPIVRGKENATLNFCESGSTARFLMPVAAALCKNCEFLGEGRLPERPFAEMIKALTEHGVKVIGDTLPMTTHGLLISGEYRISGKISSQYLTGLLFSLPLLDGESKIMLEDRLNSKNYVDMTLDTLKEFGVNIIKEENAYYIKSQSYKSPKELRAEGDWSSAAFWVVADKISGGIEVLGMNENSHQPDKAICDILDETKIDASPFPDLVPVLSILAASRIGRTEIYGASRLRFKESDRLTAMADVINNLGGLAMVTEDGLIIEGNGHLKGGKVSGVNDHRVVMSAAVASLICEDTVEIEGAEAISKSYPTFFDDFKRLGGIVDVRNG